MGRNKSNKFLRWRKKWCRSGIETNWQPPAWVTQGLSPYQSPTPLRPLSLINMSTTLMTASCDSIGTCSLDVDAESLNDCNNADSPNNHHKTGELDANSASLSERTLHSFLLSASALSSVRTPENTDTPAAKKPSYLSLACSISGYGGITTYDSKLREGFRSRDHSPGKLVGIQNGSRESSPARYRSLCGNYLTSGNIGLTGVRPCWTQDGGHGDMKTSSAFGTTQINGSNGTDQADAAGNFVAKRLTEQRNRWLESTLSPAEKVRDVHNVVSVFESSSGHHHRISTETKIEREYDSSVISVSKIVTSTTVSSDSKRNERIIPITIEGGATNRSCNLTTVESSSHSCNGTVHHPSTITPTKSFIQQRAERLYGPCALAQGFFHRSSGSPSSASPLARTENGSRQSIGSPSAAISKSTNSPVLPVMRHLRPEFREQLPVAPRRSLGFRFSTESSPKSVEATEKVEVAVPILLQTSTESLADLQPAAPEVVLPQPASPILPEMNVSIHVTTNGESKKLCSAPLLDKGDIEKSDEASLEDVKNVDVTTALREENAGHKFLRIRQEAVEKLLSLAKGAEDQIASSGLGGNAILSEEALGHLRAAAGKARLLATQKMVQFEGLCQKCICQRPEEQFPTTAEDLQGFWDMLLLQVEQVHNTFQRLEKLKAVNWCENNLPLEDRGESADSQPTASTSKRTTSKRTSRGPKQINSSAKTAEAAAARKQREEDRRKMMEQRRRELKKKQEEAASRQDSVETFARQSS